MVTKKLVVNSPQDLYQIISQVDNHSDNKIIHFMGIMHLYLHGCPCDAERHWDNLLQVYRSMGDSDLSSIKESQNCNIVQFFEEGNLLFEI